MEEGHVERDARVYIQTSLSLQSVVIRKADKVQGAAFVVGIDQLAVSSTSEGLRKLC